MRSVKAFTISCGRVARLSGRMIVDVSVIGVFCLRDAARVALLRLPGEARAMALAANLCNERRSVPSADVLSFHAPHWAIELVRTQ
jgi:hypothetical protein